MKDYSSIAAALYGGGWTSEDKDECMSEYNMTEEEWDEIVPYFKVFEKKEEQLYEKQE